MDREETVTTTDPTGFVPAAIRYEDKQLCVGCTEGVVPIVRRPLASRANYRSGVAQDDPLPGVVGGRDFVTGVVPPSGAGVRGVGF